MNGSFLAVLGTMLGLAVSPAVAAAQLSHSERTTIRLINGIRAQHGLASVRHSSALSRAAGSHSRDMIERGFFDHTSSDGTPFASRVRRYVNARMVGEVLAYIGRRRGGAHAVVRMWMESPPHRATLLTPRFRRIGIARRWGGGRAVVTADFASAR
jgi:uncharacterized protein YkwD